MAELEAIATAARALVDEAIAAARTLTRNGEAIDDHQVAVERVAYAATEARVIRELAEVPAELAEFAEVAAAELAASASHRLAPVAPVLGIAEPRYDDSVRAVIAPRIAPAAVESVGGAAIAAGGRLAWPLEDVLEEVRA